MDTKRDENILYTLQFPSDLKKLKPEQLPQVCDELRQEIIRQLSGHPGHFASSLGVVELTVALHYVFDTPYDRIVWDVGHQAYAHKMLTGRREQFDTNRTLGGLHPFPCPEESEYDTFTCGHASNSISAALGMSVAAKQQHENRHVVAVIGDGSLSGGLAFEGLNNASNTPNDLLIILNDNNMSIDRSVGGMKHYLHQLHTSRTYNNLRYRASQRLMSWGILSDDKRKQILRFNNALKSLLHNQHNMFDGMNIRYFGPSDGHDVVELVSTLRQIKEMKGPRILHLHTVKGKGFESAEKDPTTWHAPGEFDPETQERIKSEGTPLPPKYQDVFGRTIVELAKQNPRIIGVTPAMPTGCSLNYMMEEMPDRAFDVGIAEGHAVTFSGGMAQDGLLPFCNIYSAFAQRAYDNIIHDVCISRLPVVFCFDRAGIVGQDGATHHGVFDLAALRPVPNLTISSPMDEHELRRLMYTAQLPDQGPFVIRYPRGRAEHTDWQCPLEAVTIGRGRCLKEGEGIALLTLGPLGNVAARAIQRFEQQHPGVSVGHYDMRFLKPLDEDLLRQVVQRYHTVITLEDGVRRGGLGTAVLEFFADHDLNVRVKRLGLPDHFVEHGSPAQLYHLYGMDEEGITDCLASCL